MKMLKLAAAAAVMTMMASVAGAQATPLAELIEKNWANNEHWYDGQAEVAAYNGVRTIYGESRPHTLHLITVTEDLNTEYMAKADWPYGDKDLLPVMKQNQVATIATPNYPYHYMVSVFHDRENLGNGAAKMVVSSQEWCGTTFKEFQLHSPQSDGPAPAPVMKCNSYWDGEGTGERTLTGFGGNTFFEEELPLIVRALPHAEGVNAEFDLADNQTTNKAPAPETSPATLEVTDGPEDRWEINVSVEDGREWRFEVDKEYPNILRRFSGSDGRDYHLINLERDDYWNTN